MCAAPQFSETVSEEILSVIRSVSKRWSFVCVVIAVAADVPVIFVESVQLFRSCDIAWCGTRAPDAGP